MKRIILIVTIALLPVLSACLVCRVPIHDGKVTTKLVPKVSKVGNLIDLKDAKGRRLFRKPIQEGFYLSFSINNGERKIFHAIGDRVSDPKATYSGYQEKFSGAGITTQKILNVTSGYVLNNSNETVTKIMSIANISKGEAKATINLSEVKNYIDKNLQPLSAKIAATTVVDITNENCWPCQNWPKCDLGTLVWDPTKATVVCINCGKDEGLVHVVCLANLKEELGEYAEKGCDHPIISIGIDGSDGRSVWDTQCPTVQSTMARFTFGEATPATGQDRPEIALKRLLTLAPGAAIVMITEYKIILPRK